MALSMNQIPRSRCPCWRVVHRHSCGHYGDPEPIVGCNYHGNAHSPEDNVGGPIIEHGTKCAFCELVEHAEPIESEAESCECARIMHIHRCGHFQWPESKILRCESHRGMAEPEAHMTDKVFLDLAMCVACEYLVGQPFQTCRHSCGCHRPSRTYSCGHRPNVTPVVKCVDHGGTYRPEHRMLEGGDQHSLLCRWCMTERARQELRRHDRISVFTLNTGESASSDAVTVDQTIKSAIHDRERLLHDPELPHGADADHQDGDQSSSTTKKCKGRR